MQWKSLQTIVVSSSSIYLLSWICYSVVASYVTYSFAEFVWEGIDVN